MRLRSVALAAGTLLALTACGAAQKPPGVASAGTPAAEASASATASPATSSDPLKFAQCMREHGVDMKDPEPGGGITARIKGDRSKMEKAQKACGKYMQGGMLGGKGPEDPAMRDAMLKFAQCMREHGVHMDDPKPGGGIMIRKDKNADDKVVEKAHKACENLLPGRGPSQVGESGPSQTERN
ncbi:hypothetical protein [Sphaerisporangium rubeum]|uniref:Uncharacterized protein n=1 Tax=Sphaerisporangium rubeum TaxID=321317 RepID=A0A7X0IKZ9_9ACTN|nr:hypothetical protein [Sphaerisporangium rubeum]MBB6475617.1 hypothetical protein [Sphaerisporangium rubeum]